MVMAASRGDDEFEQRYLSQYGDDEDGTVYILRLDEPLGTEKHRAWFYVGWAKWFAGRMQHHRNGTGSHFTRAAWERGIGFKVVYAERGTRTRERAIKNWHDTRGFLESKGITFEDGQ